MQPPWKPWIIQPPCSLVPGLRRVLPILSIMTGHYPAFSCCSQTQRRAHLLPLLPLVTFNQLQRMIETTLLYKHESERGKRQENEETSARPGNSRRLFHFITSAYYLCLPSRQPHSEYKSQKQTWQHVTVSLIWNSCVSRLQTCWHKHAYNTKNMSIKPNKLNS